MKNSIKLFVLICFCHSSSSFLKAQPKETVLSNYYFKGGSRTEVFPDGKWAVFSIDSEMAYQARKDSLSVAIFSSTGELLNTIHIEPEYQYERFFTGKLLILSDTTFVVSYSGNDCDQLEGSFSYYEAYHISGELRWRMYQIFPYLIRFAQVNKDGDLLFFEYDHVLTISGWTGDTIATSAIPFDSYENVISIPGTDEMIMNAHNALHIIRLNAVTGDYEDVLSGNLSLPFEFGTIVWHEDDFVYVLYTHSIYALITIDRQLNIDTVLLLNPYIYDFTVRHDTLLIADGSDPNFFRITSYDTAGNELSTFKSPNDGVRLNQIRANDSGVILVAAYGSGPDNSVPIFHHTERSQVMSSYFPGGAFQTDPDSVSIRITSIEKTADFSVHKFNTTGHNYSGPVYDFEGGDFYIEIENDGELPVTSFWLNTAFEYTTNYYKCGPKVSNTRHFDSLFIAPGEKMTVQFGDVNAFYQLHLPDEFCFWPSGPNRAVDDLAREDIFCIEGIVATDNPIVQDVFISPNPANDQIQITLDQHPSAVPIYLFNTLGTVVKSEIIPGGENYWLMDINRLPTGMYYVKVGALPHPVVIIK